MPVVLLVEDDDSQRFVAAFALKKAGHEVHEAADGPSGLEAAHSRRPDVIVCDVMMPGMTGYEVVETLRADPATANTPIVLLTAMSDRKHMRQGMSSGADDYLTKPYKPAELCEAVNAALAKRQLQEEAFLHSVSDRVSEALEEQKEDLGRRYEQQLAREVNARWARAAAAGDAHFDDAVLLLADLLGDAKATAAEGLPQLAKKAQQQGRDTCYLFGAAHVLAYGDDLLAVFAGDTASETTSVEARALRAAMALLQSATRQPGMSLALHRGPVALVAVHDGLHGDSGHALVPGDAITAVAGLRTTANAQGWSIAASAPITAALGELAGVGRQATTARGQAAVEIVPASGA